MPCPVYSSEELFMEAQEQGNNEKIIFQRGFKGSTGCVLSFNPVHPVIPSIMKKPQMNADKRRFVHRASAFHNFFFREQFKNNENHSN
jgi:hypothetical protein